MCHQVPNELYVFESDAKGRGLTCSKVLQYHVSHLSRGVNVFAKPSMLVRFAAGSFECGNEPSLSMKGEETS